MKLHTEKFEAADGPSKQIIITRDDGSTVAIKLSVEHARMLTNALKSRGKDISLEATRVTYE